MPSLPCGTWINASELRRPYHCESLTSWWPNTCTRKYATRPAAANNALRLRPCSASAADINATRILELLVNRTVVIAGVSTAANLWCAMVCHLVRTAYQAQLDEQVTRGIGGMLVARIRFTGGSVDWLLPPPPSESSLDILPRLAARAANDGTAGNDGTGGAGGTLGQAGTRGLDGTADGLIAGVVGWAASRRRRASRASSTRLISALRAISKGPGDIPRSSDSLIPAARITASGSDSVCATPNTRRGSSRSTASIPSHCLHGSNGA